VLDDLDVDLAERTVVRQRAGPEDRPGAVRHARGDPVEGCRRVDLLVAGAVDLERSRLGHEITGTVSVPLHFHLEGVGAGLRDGLGSRDGARVLDGQTHEGRAGGPALSLDRGGCVLVGRVSTNRPGRIPVTGLLVTRGGSGDEGVGGRSSLGWSDCS